jgi:hypothetical protein
MGRRIRHAPSAARGTEAAALAQEGDDTVETARVHAHEAVGEDAAAEKAAELPRDEAGHRTLTCLRTGKERRELASYDVVEDALLGAAAHVAGVAAARAVTGRR